MTMPVMTGFQLAEKLRALNPEIGIIICSGYNEDTRSHKFHAGMITAFLQKPVTMRELTKAVRNILDQG